MAGLAAKPILLTCWYLASAFSITYYGYTLNHYLFIIFAVN